MYLHIGDDTIIPLKEIIMIINSDEFSNSKTNLKFYANCESKGFNKKLDTEEIKSYVLTDRYLYNSSVSTLTLAKRAQSDHTIAGGTSRGQL